VANQSSSKGLTITLCLLATAISSVGMDAYLPALPLVQNYYNVSSYQVQSTVVTYLIGFGVGSLIFGPFSDRFGRKPTLIVGLSGFILFSIMLPFCQNIDQMLFLRFLQGIMVGAPGVITKSIIVDIYHDLLSRIRYMTYIATAWGSGIVIAPLIGSYIINFWGWQAPFYFMAVYAFVVLTILLFIPETLKSPTNINISQWAKNGIEILSNKNFIVFTLYCVLLYSLMSIGNVLLPFIIQSTLHFSTIEYGRIIIIISAGWFSGNLLNRLLLKWIPVKRLLILAFFLLIFLATAMVVTSLFITNISLLVIFSCFILMCGGICYPNCLGIIMGQNSHISGSVSSLATFFIFAFSGLTGAISGYFPYTSMLPLACGYLIFSVLLTILFFIFVRKIKL
jgi:multidrug resistance protein